MAESVSTSIISNKSVVPALLEDDDIQARLRNDFIREFKDRLKVREIEGSEQSNARLTFSEKKNFYWKHDDNAYSSFPRPKKKSIICLGNIARTSFL